METTNQKDKSFQYKHLLKIINPKYLTIFAYYLILIAYVFGLKDIFIYILPMLWTNTILGNWLALFYIDEMIQGIHKSKIIDPKRREIIRWFMILIHLIPTIILTGIGISYYSTKSTYFPIFESFATVIIILIIYTIFSPKKVYGNIPYNLMIVLYLPITLLSMYFVYGLTK